MEDFGFEKLIVYQKSRLLVKDTYGILQAFPTFEKYGLCDQMRRASVSVPSNIVEGMSRNSIKEQLHFIEIAYASLMELFCQYQLAVDLCYIEEDKFLTAKNQIQELSRILSKLRLLRIEKIKESNG